MTEDSAIEQSASISSPSGISHSNSKIRTKTKTNSQNTLQIAEEYQLKQLRHLQYEQVYNISRSRDNKLGLLFSNLSRIGITQTVTFEHLVKIAHGIPNLDGLKQNITPSVKFPTETVTCPITNCKPVGFQQKNYLTKLLKNEAQTVKPKSIAHEKRKENQSMPTFSDKSTMEKQSTKEVENIAFKNIVIKKEKRCSPSPSCYINNLEFTLPKKTIQIKSEVVDDFQFSVDSEQPTQTAEPNFPTETEERVTADLDDSISNEPSIGPDSIPEIEESTNKQRTSESSTTISKKPRKRKIGPSKKRGRPAATKQSPNPESETKKARKSPRKVYRRGKEKTFEEKDSEWVLPYHARGVKRTRSKTENGQDEKGADNQSQEESEELDD
ncbi:hypothetical protein B9Z55_026366 [Caenorhabditis nigoni]|uniref:Uncharacterized protein n=1 Tax=Caenorhabditis nigoni TaxID=1611254 RepID=A0A2G5T2U3_9PELO|nr:hypothetical protein B9Z55_026366 [Caenorhabditis nigoni]